jgi:hypothetical protein
MTTCHLEMILEPTPKMLCVSDLPQTIEKKGKGKVVHIQCVIKYRAMKTVG